MEYKTEAEAFNDIEKRVFRATGEKESYEIVTNFFRVYKPSGELDHVFVDFEDRSLTPLVDFEPIKKETASAIKRAIASVFEPNYSIIEDNDAELVIYGLIPESDQHVMLRVIGDNLPED